MADVRIPICVRCGADLVRIARSEVACRSCDGGVQRNSHGAPRAAMVPASSVNRRPTAARTRPVAIAAALATTLWAASFAHHGDGLSAAFASAEGTAVQPLGTSVQRSVEAAAADDRGRGGTASTLAAAGAQTSPVDAVGDAPGVVASEPTEPTYQEGDTGSIAAAPAAVPDTTSTLPELAQAGPVSGARQGARAPARPDEDVADDTAEGPGAADPFGPGTDGVDSGASDVAPPWPSPGTTAPTPPTTTATTPTTVRPPASTAPAPPTTPPPVVTAPSTTTPATTAPETTTPADPAPTTTTPPPDPDPTPAP